MCRSKKNILLSAGDIHFLGSKVSVHCWLLWKTNTLTKNPPHPPLSLSFYWVTCYSLSLRLVWVSCPGYIPSQTFAHLQSSGLCGEAEETALMLHLPCSAPAETLVCHQHPSRAAKESQSPQTTPQLQLNAFNVEDNPAITR